VRPTHQRRRALTGARKGMMMPSSNARRTLEPEDLLRLRFLQDAKLSPDGTWIAYSVSQVDPEADEERIAIWLLSPATGALRQLTPGNGNGSNIAWSPDGRQIAFFSTESGTKQLYLIPVEGGAARRLTDLPQGVGRGPAWSPDGQTIAFSARATAEPVFPTRPYRVTRHIYRLDGLGYLDQGVHDLFIVPASGGEPRNLTRDRNHNCRYVAPVWSPDSREILFTATFFPDSYRFFPALRAVTLDGTLRDVVKEWGYGHSAGYTPDGRRIVFVGNRQGVPFGAQNHLWVIDRQGGEPECRTTGLRYNVHGALQGDMPIVARDQPGFEISRDGQNAYVRVQDGGTLQIYRVALTGAISYEPVVAGQRACYPLGLHDDRVLFSANSLNAPVDLFMADVHGGNERQLTCLNAEVLAELSLPQIEPLVFTSSDGTSVEGWLMKPPVGRPPYPTILYIHGGPHHGYGNTFSCDFQMLAGSGYAVLLINYRGSTGYGDAFSTMIDGRLGEIEYADLMAGVDHAIDRGLADPDRLGVCGLSYGGFLTCWIVGHTERFKAAVPENPVTNRQSWYGASDMALSHLESVGGHPHEVPEAYWRCSPVSYAHRCTTPTLLIQGEHDLRCPPEQSEQFYTVLKANGCVVEMLRLPESPHMGSVSGPLPIRRAQNEALLDWMNRHV